MRVRSRHLVKIGRRRGFEHDLTQSTPDQHLHKAAGTQEWIAVP